MANPMFRRNWSESGSGATAVPDSVQYRAPAPGNSTGVPTAAGYGLPGLATEVATPHAMTVGGTCTVAALMLSFVAVGARLGWGKVVLLADTDAVGREVLRASIAQPAWFYGSLVVAVVLSLVAMFKPTTARILAVPYALAEGVALGIISRLYEAQFKGIALQAVLATCGVLLTMLALYGLRILRATPRFVKVVTAATLGIGAVYLVAFLGNAFFGNDLGIWSSTSGLSIAFTVGAACVAAFNLVIDFDFIERGAAERLPKYMEWYGALALVVTIVWLYIEMLRLLSKLRR
ncbi:MAG: Bax inhibitor-1/YccA family protein [Microthrixaceae bacterium]